MLDQGFHANIIGYSQQNWYARLPIFTDRFILKTRKQVNNVVAVKESTIFLYSKYLKRRVEYYKTV